MKYYILKIFGLNVKTKKSEFEYHNIMMNNMKQQQYLF